MNTRRALKTRLQRAMRACSQGVNSVDESGRGRSNRNGEAKTTQRNSKNGDVRNAEHTRGVENQRRRGWTKRDRTMKGSHRVWDLARRDARVIRRRQGRGKLSVCLDMGFWRGSRAQTIIPMTTTRGYGRGRFRMRQP